MKRRNRGDCRRRYRRRCWRMPGGEFAANEGEHLVGMEISNGDQCGLVRPEASRKFSSQFCWSCGGQGFICWRKNAVWAIAEKHFSNHAIGLEGRVGLLLFKLFREIVLSESNFIIRKSGIF